MVKTSDIESLRKENKDGLLKTLNKARQELQEKRIGKLTSQNSKDIAPCRKRIAAILTVISQTQRQQMRLASKKQKFLPTDLRSKKTRAMRRALTPHERSLKTVKQQKKLAHFPLRKYAVKAAK